ncbi:MAG: TolC family protein, partial [Bdellovibrionota bacterium]
MKSFLVFFMVLSTLFLPMAQALVGLDGLESKLIEKNHELLSLKEQVEAKESLYSSAGSGFYPTINVAGGWVHNKTDDLAVAQKGSVAYIEGRYNIFNGLKDLSALNQKDADLKLAKIDLETKTLKLRLLLTETISDMIRLHRLQKILEEEFEITQTQ